MAEGRKGLFLPREDGTRPAGMGGGTERNDRN